METKSHKQWNAPWLCYRVVKGGGPRGGGSLIFPNVPQSSLGILRVPQFPPPPLNTPPLRNPTIMSMFQEWNTPRKNNIEPEKDDLEDDFPFQKRVIFR